MQYPKAQCTPDRGASRHESCSTSICIILPALQSSLFEQRRLIDLTEQLFANLFPFPALPIKVNLLICLQLVFPRRLG